MKVPVCSSIQSEAAAWARLPGSGSGLVRRDWQEAFAAAGLLSMDDFLVASGEPLSKPGLGERYRGRLAVPKDGAIRAVYLKRYGSETWGRRLRRWYEDGRWRTAADREAEVGLALAEEAVPVAEVLAWGSCPNGGVRSFLALLTAPGIPLHHWAGQADLAAGTPESWRRKCEAVCRLAAFTRRFHELGWRHRDLYLCHIFVTEVDHRLALTLIDLQRMFRPRWRGERWRIKDLAQLNYSARPQFCTRVMRVRFARAYLNAAKLTPAQKRWLRRIARKTQAIARHDRQV